MKIAIVYASVYGQTRTIAEFLKKTFVPSENSENSVQLIEITRNGTRALLRKDTDVVVIGAPIYAGGFPKALMKWVQANKSTLVKKQLAYYTVSLNVADHRPDARAADKHLMKKLINETGMLPNYADSFAGALRYTAYGWLKRYVMKRISRSVGGPIDTSQDYEFTDWNQVRAFAETILYDNKNHIEETIAL